MRIKPAAALLAGAIVIVALAAVAIVLSNGDGDFEAQAEFTNARGLLAGNEVRIGGAPAGSVEEIELTDRGTALVTMRLHGGLERLRADAVAAIRPVDLLGDIYLSVSPGSSRDGLDGPIPVRQTSNRPRLDELLSTFRAPQRAGLQAMLVELGRALEGRGTDLNRAVVELRPALEASDELMQELASQNTDLRRLVSDAGRASNQVAGRKRDLQRLVESFAATFDATAANAAALDRGLERAPAALARLTRTAGGLERAGNEATPLAAGLRDAAPGLALALQRLDPFLARATPAVEDVRPVLRSLDEVLRSSQPAVRDLRTGLDVARGASAEFAQATDVLADAAPGISEGFFQNFPDEAEAAGKGSYPDAAERNYWSGAGVMSCEAFGVPIGPGCLFDAFTSFGLPVSSAARSAAEAGSDRPQPRREGPGRAAAGGPTPAPPAPASDPPASAPVVPGAPPTPQTTLLDFLLGP